MHAHGDCHACHSKEAAGHAFCYFSQRSSAAPPLLEADERLAVRIHIIFRSREIIGREAASAVTEIIGGRSYKNTSENMWS
jgi:hypothetical protein